MGSFPYEKDLWSRVGRRGNGDKKDEVGMSGEEG